ncbi:hypothetical protein D9M72_621060 [compost metagenome]
MPSIIIQKKFPYQKVGVKIITGKSPFIKAILNENTGKDQIINLLSPLPSYTKYIFAWNTQKNRWAILRNLAPEGNEETINATA